MVGAKIDGRTAVGDPDPSILSPSCSRSVPGVEDGTSPGGEGVVFATGDSELAIDDRKDEPPGGELIFAFAGDWGSEPGRSGEELRANEGAGRASLSPWLPEVPDKLRSRLSPISVIESTADNLCSG